MVSDADIVNALGRMRRRLAPAIEVERVVLFGSRARGDARPDSDVDVILVSRSFRGRTFVRRAYPVRKAWDLDVAVDFLCYTPEEFATLAARTSIVQVALREGREILA